MAVRIYTIPPERPFADTLARGLLDRFSGAPLSLADVTLLLPTRRACRAVEESFLRQSGGDALLLPAITPVGDIDEDSVGFLTGVFDIPPEVSPLRRQLLLTQLILQKGVAEGAPPSEAQAARLAAELARLLDQVQTERLSFDALDTLVPEDYARHWQVTLDFLALVTRAWPGVLAEEGLIDPSDRRNRLIEAQLAAWQVNPPGPVIAAGSTGSVPATADLLAAVAVQPQGEVILPGLDTELSASVADLPATHPQYGMVRLLARLKRSPADVPVWPPGAEAATSARSALINRALQPPEIPAPVPAPDFLADGLEGVRRVDCPGPREEAGVIALALREALESEGRRAALVTPDRSLARRVAAELRRWNIEIDDSAGQPLADTPPAAFLRLVARLAGAELEPVALLSALKHPLAAGGQAPRRFRGQVGALEMAALRGVRPAPGFAGLRKALASGGDGGLTGFVDGLEARLAGLTALLTRAKVSPAVILNAHIAAAEALSATDDMPGAERLWAGEAGEALANFIADLHDAAAVLPEIHGAGWPGLFEALMAGVVVRPRFGRHPRLHIWGPLEARLQQADLLVLGGLNEGTWPGDPGADPWLSRPMRTRFGLPAPERRIGLSAHDFVQGFAGREVLLTRATRVDGAPTVPSRWLMRIDNLLQAGGLDGALRREEAKWLGWQRLLDQPETPADQTEELPIRAPAPCPPVAARPRRLSVTQVETLRRDPYAVYARHVLGLRALDPIDADPGAADRGNVIHEALENFLQTYPDTLPDDPLNRLLACGEQAFTDIGDRPGVRAFWWPRFERIAAWFLDQERRRRETIRRVHSEITGELRIDAPGGTFILTAKADRIEVRADGSLAISDYKTGGVPRAGDIALGFAPQLPLEAAIAAAGGFPGVPAGAPAVLSYWRLTGGEPPGEVRDVKADAADLARSAHAGLIRTVALFDDPETIYAPEPDSDYRPRYSDYRHLARIDEWITGA